MRPKDINLSDIVRDLQTENVIHLNQSSLKEINACDVEITPQPWLWKSYIPLETCTLIAGRGGIGKSQFLLYFAGLVSNGSNFTLNNESNKIDQGSVLILSAEDNVESSIVPRLKAVNANMKKIGILVSTLENTHSLNERAIALDKDIISLEERIKARGDVKLVIFDPITAYLGDIQENKSSHVRNLILRLNRLAEKYKLAIILNTHTRKKGNNEKSSGSAADEIMGSSAWYNTPRQAYTISVDHENKDRILFICCKSNCGAKPTSFDYAIEVLTVAHKGVSIETTRIKFLAGDVSITSDEALNKENYDKKLATEEAKEFIKRVLSFGLKSYEQIKTMAFSEGINEATLKFARQRLKGEGVNVVVEPSQMDKRKMIWYIGSDQNNSDK